MEMNLRFSNYDQVTDREGEIIKLLLKLLLAHDINEIPRENNDDILKRRHRTNNAEKGLEREMRRERAK